MSNVVPFQLPDSVLDREIEAEDLRLEQIAKLEEILRNIDEEIADRQEGRARVAAVLANVRSGGTYP